MLAKCIRISTPKDQNIRFGQIGHKFLEFYTSFGNEYNSQFEFSDPYKVSVLLMPFASNV